jgi:hypothetical protein
MKKTAFLLLLIYALFEARGQKVSDPRSSSFWSKPQQFGISLGFGGIMQTGTLIANECNCSFENGGGMSSAFGITYEDELAKNIVWGLAGEYRYISMDSRYQELETLENQRTSSGALVNMEVPFRHNAAFSTSMIGLLPYIKIFPFDTRLFTRFGLNIGYMTSATLTHTKELLQKRTVLATGETVEFSLDPTDPRVKGNTATIQDGDLPKLNSLFLGGHIGIGAEFRAGKKLIFGPTMLYIIPFTSVSSYPGSDFSFNNLQVAIEARISLD